MVMAALLYANDGMVASTYPGWLKSEFDTLTGLFDRVGIQTNVRKTVGMMRRPCRAYGVRSDKSYTQRMTAEGRIFKERQRERMI